MRFNSEAATKRGLRSQKPRRMLSIASVGASQRMVFDPMFEEAAAPEIATAVATSRSRTADSISFVGKYPVAALPTNCGLNRKKSASRPRLFAYREFCRLMAALMR